MTTSDDTKVDTSDWERSVDCLVKQNPAIPSGRDVVAQFFGLRGDDEAEFVLLAIHLLPKVTAERDDLRHALNASSCEREAVTHRAGELERDLERSEAERDEALADAACWELKATQTEQKYIALSARVKELEAGLEATANALKNAIDLIDKHVPRDALGTNSAGGGDGWNDQSWPILDECLHYLKEDLSKARALIGKEPSK